MKIAVLFLLSGWLLVAAPPRDPLLELNAAFREAYAARKAEAFEHQGPVLLQSGDSLFLYRDQKVVAEALVRPPRYHQLKALDHVPPGLRLMAGPEGTLAPGRGQRLAALREMLAAVKTGQPGEEPILTASLGLLDGILARNRVSGKDLDDYCRAMRAPLEANLEAAAALELEALSTAVARWRKVQLAADWDAVAVVVIGSHMARDGEVSLQFFTRLLGQAGEGGRVVFAEEKWDPKDALGLLATHVVDRDLGVAFFGDGGRMHRDVMAMAAKKWLDSHPPAP